MLKQTIQYDDIDGEQVTATLWFHMNQLEIEKDMELEVLQARFQKFQDEVFGDGPRQLTPAENRELYRLVETLVRASYGKRYGPDNKLFTKKAEVWDEFNDSGAYDGFMRWLFADEGARANVFITNIWPKQLREQVEQAVRETSPIKLVEDVELPVNNTMVQEIAPDDNVQSITELSSTNGYEIMDRLGDYSDATLVDMSEGEFNAVIEKFRTGNNVPSRLLVLGFQRNSGAGQTTD